MSSKISFLLLIGLTIAAVGCKEDCPEFVTTPYVVDVPQGLPEMVIPEDNPMTVEGVTLGRKLFYDPILSKNEEQSCSSCHQQEFAFATQDQFQQGVDGQFGDRNSMALVNLAWGRDFFWDGRANSLEEQALQPVTNPIEMATTWPEVLSKLNAHDEYPQLFKSAFNVDVIDSMDVAKAIAQFERTLVSGNSRFDAIYNRQQGSFTDAEGRGLVLFNSEEADCFHCHGLGGLITDNEFRNNGLDEVLTDMGRYNFTGVDSDRGKFKIPTLRNIAVTAPYMHDGRFFSLRDVIDHYSDHVQANSPNLDPLMELVANGANGAELSEADKDDLEAFLNTFTDQEFLTNPDFADPNN